ncbi:MAG: hypothetical protein ACRD47_13290, partial [Nitrososphaeraceae archaeon]
GIITNDVAGIRPTKILIFVCTSIFYVSVSVNNENLASYLIADSCASLTMDFWIAELLDRITPGCRNSPLICN